MILVHMWMRAVPVAYEHLKHSEMNRKEYTLKYSFVLNQMKALWYCENSTKTAAGQEHPEVCGFHFYCTQ